ncbi:MAG: sigma-70 family RNA polymerase sigma factor [Actinobacteria bacterium]|nr:sigma-70 family RNA polymerase sigma factor [Actinomycetota bacterium]
MARAIREAIIGISATPIPWVVTAGVPTRIPLVTAGVSGSYGMAFLFKVIPDLPHRSSATFPFIPVLRISISARCVSVPPETARIPSLSRELANALQILPERTREILMLRSQGKTLGECGKLLGITRERVRQIQHKALETLRRSPAGRALECFLED